MNDVKTLLDSAPGPGDRDSRADWRADVERSLSTDQGAWLSLANVEQQLVEPRAWALLGWVEDSATTIAQERRAELVSLAAFAMSLLQASRLDRRDVMVVAALVRRATDAAGLDFPDLVRSGCQRAGELGQETLEWLWWASEKLPPTHEEVGQGESFEFRRLPAAFDADDLVERLTRHAKKPE